MRKARRLRADMPLAERRFWDAIRKHGLNMRRQAPIGLYVADFAHHHTRIVVEIDGYWHTTAEGGQRDALRDAWFAEAGYRVIRLPEPYVRENAVDAAAMVADLIRKTAA